MILIVTNKNDYTADFLILGLKERDLEFSRLNTEDFPQNIELNLYISNASIEGEFLIYGEKVSLQEIDSIWYRRPLPSIPDPQISDPAARRFVLTESKVTLQSLWSLVQCRWISRPDKIREAESKLYQLKIASELGFQIPKTLITNSPSSAKAFFEENQSIITKPQRHGRISHNGQFGHIYTNIVESKHVSSLDKVRYVATLFQEYIFKAVEIRVTVVGNSIFSVGIYSQEVSKSKHDWRRANVNDLRHELHELPLDIQEKCIELTRRLGLLFSAIDLILTPDGTYVFLEINPNGQWAWMQELCPEVKIREALIDLMTNTGQMT